MREYWAEASPEIGRMSDTNMDNNLMAGLEGEERVSTGGSEHLALGVEEENMVAAPHNESTFLGHDTTLDSWEPEPWDREDSMVVMAQRQGGLSGRIKAAILKTINYIVRLRGSPEEIAWGLSIGLFIAMSPTVGLQMAIAIPVATALRGNPAAAAAGCWLTNPVTIPVLYGLNYWLGASILGYEQSFIFEGPYTFDWILSLLNSGSHVLWSLIVGGLITGFGCALFAYYPMKQAVRGGRAALIRRRERRKARREARVLALKASQPPATMLKSPTDRPF